MNAIEIRAFVAPGFEENGYLVWRCGSAAAVAVDPGGAVEEMLALLEAERLGLEAIVLTHAHLDHVEGLGELKDASAAPVWMHPADKALYERAPEQAAFFGMRLRALPPIDHDLTDDQQLSLAGIDMEVRHVPGHSPGHVILYLPAAGAALVGDVIFHGSIGRTDLPGGNFAQLIRGIRDRVFTLPGETRLYTGHGPPTTVDHERATNPFLIPHYGGGLA